MYFKYKIHMCMLNTYLKYMYLKYCTALVKFNIYSAVEGIH